MLHLISDCSVVMAYYNLNDGVKQMETYYPEMLIQTDVGRLVPAFDQGLEFDVLSACSKTDVSNYYITTSAIVLCNGCFILPCFSCNCVLLCLKRIEQER